MDKQTVQAFLKGCDFKKVCSTLYKHFPNKIIWKDDLSSYWKNLIERETVTPEDKDIVINCPAVWVSREDPYVNLVPMGYHKKWERRIDISTVPYSEILGTPYEEPVDINDIFFDITDVDKDKWDKAYSKACDKNCIGAFLLDFFTMWGTDESYHKKYCELVDKDEFPKWNLL